MNHTATIRLGDSMILTFHVPALPGGRDYVISIVYSLKKFRKISRKSWHGGIKPIRKQMGKLELSPIIYRSNFAVTGFPNFLIFF